MPLSGGLYFVAGPASPEAGDHGGHLGPVRAVDIAEPGDQVALLERDAPTA